MSILLQIICYTVPFLRSTYYQDKTRTCLQLDNISLVFSKTNVGIRIELDDVFLRDASVDDIHLPCNNVVRVRVFIIESQSVKISS